MIHTIHIGTRSSKLALWQANWVKEQIESKHPELKVSLVPIKTTGDKELNVLLSKIGGKGLFIKEIEDKLLDKKIDLAVHSLKDVPAELPKGLTLVAYPPREDFRDVLVSQKGVSFEELEPGAKVGTSSLRRSSQLKMKRRDLNYPELRGNVDTRLKKLHDGKFDALVMAAAGLIRLGLRGEITQHIKMIPAVGQGAMVIEIREKDAELKLLLSFLDHPETRICVEAERAFLKVMGAGCQVPLGCHATLDGNQMNLEAFLSDVEGKKYLSRCQKVPQSDGMQTAAAMAKEILASGGREILDSIS